MTDNWSHHTCGAAHQELRWRLTEPPNCLVQLLAIDDVLLPTLAADDAGSQEVASVALDCGSLAPRFVAYQELFCQVLNQRLPAKTTGYDHPGDLLVDGAKVLMEMWRRQYNQVRPHSSLGCRPPAPEIIPGPATAVAAQHQG